MQMSPLKLGLALVSVVTIVAVATVAYMSSTLIAYKVTSPGEVVSLESARALESLDGSDSSAIKRLAEDDFDSGRYQSAANRWARVSGLEPLESEPYYQWARSLYMLGQFDQVHRMLEDERAIGFPPAQLLLIRMLFADGDLATALAKSASLKATGFQSDNLKLLDADLAVAGGNLNEASEAYQQLAASNDYQVMGAAKLGLAQLALKRSDTQTALIELESLEPDLMGAAGAELLARLYLQLGQQTAALAVFDSLIERFGPRSAWVVEIADQLAALGDRTGLIERRGSMTEVNVEAVSARYYLDSLVAYLDENCEAFLDSTSWASSHSSRPLSRWLQLDCSTYEGDIDSFNVAAQGSYLTTLAEPLKARLYKRLLSRAFPAINSGRGELAAKYAEAAQYLAQPHAEADLMLARAQLLLEDNKRAFDLAQPLINDDLHRVGSLEIVARSLIAQEQFIAAESYIESLISSAPTTGLGEYWLGVSRRDQGDLAGAEKSFKQAFALNYKDKAGLGLMGLYLSQGRLDDIDELAKWFLSSDDAVRKTVGTTYMAAAAAGKRDYLTAAQRYEEAVELVPEMIAYYLQAADNYIKARAFDSAEIILSRAEAKAPTNIYVAFKLAYAAEQADQIDTAEKRYRTLILREPQWALPQLNLASILSKQENQLDEAYKFASSAYRLNPDWPEAVELYRDLGEQVRTNAVPTSPAAEKVES